METRDIPKVIHGLRQNPLFLYQLILNAGRYAIHPLERRLAGGWSLAPRSISIMITDRCNLRCRMCHYAYSESAEFSLNHAGFMSMELFEHILDTCPGKPIISLTGGEPLLHPQVVDFIRELKRRGFLCSLTTNGSFLQARAAELCESGLDLLVVSIDGCEETHDRIRSQGAYKRAVAGIEEILKMPDRPLVTISTVIMDNNHRELQESFSLAEALGVDMLNFNHLWMHTDEMVLEQKFQSDPTIHQDQEARTDQPDLPQNGRVLWKVNTEDIDPDCVFDALQAIKKKNRRFLVHEYPELNREQIGIYYHHPGQLVKVRNSRCAWQTMKIYPDGEVGICREYHAGNVKDQPLEEIWNNPKYRQFRRYLSKKGTCPICSRCCLVFSRM